MERARRRTGAHTPDTRQRILAAACDEFGAHGFAATTVDRIADRARVNKAMIYYHFRNKRALYTCIIRDVFAPISARVRAAIAEDAPPDTKAHNGDRHAGAVGRRLDVLPPDFSSRDRRRRRQPRAGRARAHCRHVCDRERDHHRRREAERLSARPSGACAFHAHRAAHHVPRHRARPRAHQERAPSRNSRCGLGHDGASSANGRASHAGAA